MNNQAIIIASAGTAVPEALTAITAVEDALSASAPDCLCLRAFTSRAIRRALKDRGESAPGLLDAFKHLAAQNIRRVIVQPTLLLCGREYDSLKAEAESFAPQFTSLTVGQPLLAAPADLQRFARHLSQDHPPENAAVTVFMGHGTAHSANAVYPALQDALHSIGREDIYIGTMRGQPGLDAVLRQLPAPRKIHLLPLLLTAGSHAQTDISQVWKPRLESAGHTVTCSFTGLGQLAWVQKMYQGKLTALL